MKHFNLLTLDQLAACSDQLNRFTMSGSCERPGPRSRQGDQTRKAKPLALITFDDGYIDCHAIALPILKKHGATAVFFLPTSFIGTNRLAWWDAMAWILRHARNKTIQLWGIDEPLLLDGEHIEQSIQFVLRLSKWRRFPITVQVEELAEACGIAPLGDRVDGPLFLNWEQVREMHAEGMDIGSHTHSHPLLSHLDVRAQEHELAYSKAILEAELKSSISAIAYPDGGRDCFDACTTARPPRGLSTGIQLRPLCQSIAVGQSV